MTKRALQSLVAAALTLTSVAAAQAPDPPVGEWHFYGGDALSNRYAPLDAIDRTNFESLEVAWRWSQPRPPS